MAVLGRGTQPGLTHLNDIILFLKHSTSQWTLVAIVEPIWIGAVLYKEVHKPGVSVVGGEHQLVGSPDGQSLVERLEKGGVHPKGY